LAGEHAHQPLQRVCQAPAALVVATSRSKTPCRDGQGPAGGQRRYSRSRSTSETGYPTEAIKPRLHS
jgi:hypothetical protein